MAGSPEPGPRSSPSQGESNRKNKETKKSLNTGTKNQNLLVTCSNADLHNQKGRAQGNEDPQLSPHLFPYVWGFCHYHCMDNKVHNISLAIDIRSVTVKDLPFLA